MSKVKVYISEHCAPCKEVKELLEKGHFLINGTGGEVELIDIETEEGFSQIQEYDLTGVPQAFLEGKQCKITIDNETETILIECDNENAGA